jgi:hypothetical protein
MSITLNGQLLLCKLAEELMKVPGLKLIQCNTDGITVKLPRAQKPALDVVTFMWCDMTKLNLEEVAYSRMMIRDVNNYIGVYENGTRKRKGAYEWDLEWHQNASALVVPKVAEKVLVDGAPIRQTIEQWPDIMDFMLRVKAPRNCYLQWGDHRVQNTTRYLISKSGSPLRKWMPPLKGKQEWRGIAVESGWKVRVCNNIQDAKGVEIDFDYYVREVEKLCLTLN